MPLDATGNQGRPIGLVGGHWSETQHSLERIVCHNNGSAHLENPLDQTKNCVSLRQQSSAAVVDIWEKSSTHDPPMMALVCLLHFRAAQHNINVCIMHISGIDNNVADAISHFQMARFHQLVPMANLALDPLPDWPQHSFTNASCSAVVMNFPLLQDIPT